MLNQGKGLRSKGLNHLPPKRPTTATNPAHLDSLRPQNGFFRTSNHCAGYEKNDDITPPTEPLWLNELLDSPKASGRRFSHRRSASDTNAFFEAPSDLTKVGGVFEEQFVQMFSNLQVWESSPGNIGEVFSQARNAAASGVDRSDSWTPFLNIDSSTSVQKCGRGLCHGDMKAAQARYMKSELEVGAQGGANCDEGLKMGDLSSMLENDIGFEAQQTKGPSNRQSVQRSRVRKLQYIAELERRVNILQTEVATLSPQVAYLDCQRSLLTEDNKALKKRIMAALNEKQFKNSHFEAMEKERQQLKLLHHQQNSQLASRFQVSASQLNQSMLRDEKADPAVTDDFVRLARASSIPPSTQGTGMSTGWTDWNSSAVKKFTPFSCTMAGNGNSQDSAMLLSDCMVQNP